MKLQGKTAIITGGNSGIGLAIAEKFSQEGANVVIFGRDEETLQSAKNMLDGNALTVQGDVRNEVDLIRLVEQTKAHYGGVDVIVANAGGATIEAFQDVTNESFDFQTDINFKGVFFTIQKATAIMNDGGSVVITSSSAHLQPVPGMSIYGAAKAAVTALGRTLAIELAPRNIRVNTLTPGPVITPAYSRTGLSEEQIKAFQSEQASKIPLGRIGQPVELATAALFLASSDSSYMTGSDLVVDGGMTLG